MFPEAVVIGPVWPQNARCPKCREKTAIVGAEVTLENQQAQVRGIHVFCLGRSCSWSLPLTRGADE
jgi:hypothetical protein